ncbi:hypothetical protein, partial [Roseicitreum antarcticum]
PLPGVLRCGVPMSMMMRLDATDFIRRSGAFVDRQLPQIEVWALNWTADDALAAVQDKMKVEFDRPTRWTLNAFQVWRATKSKRVAMVQERPSVARRHYLKVQNKGGARPQTALERLIDDRVISDTIIRAVIPTQNARLNSYGNWSPGERNQVVSSIGAQRSGAASIAAASKTRGRKRGRASYFVPKPGQLSPGIWKRTAGGRLSMVALFDDGAPVYKPRLDFEGAVAKAYREKLEGNLRKAFARAVRTAR